VLGSFVLVTAAVIEVLLSFVKYATMRTVIEWASHQER